MTFRYAGRRRLATADSQPRAAKHSAIHHFLIRPWQDWQQDTLGSLPMFSMLNKGKRINRATFWTIVVAAMIMSLIFHRVSIIFSLAALVASSKRCRDFGWPGWTAPAIYGALFGFFVSSIGPYSEVIKQHPNDLASAAPGAAAAVGIYLLLNLIFTITIGSIPGSADINKFGPPPLPGIGKGMREDAGLARVFGDDSAPDRSNSHAQRAQPARRIEPTRVAQSVAAPVHAGSPAHNPAMQGHPIRAGFGRKGLSG
jgi:uncharacterized membrane protein YhaH (DUF805 family)